MKKSVETLIAETRLTNYLHALKKIAKTVGGTSPGVPDEVLWEHVPKQVESVIKGLREKPLAQAFSIFKACYEKLGLNWTYEIDFVTVDLPHQIELLKRERADLKSHNDVMQGELDEYIERIESYEEVILAADELYRSQSYLKAHRKYRKYRKARGMITEHLEFDEGNDDEPSDDTNSDVHERLEALENKFEALLRQLAGLSR